MNKKNKDISYSQRKTFEIRCSGCSKMTVAYQTIDKIDEYSKTALCWSCINRKRHGDEGTTFYPYDGEE